MATPDFNKIWATNSPLTKYEFTDENYLTGWNFIGSIPPARSMFDTLQKSTDEKLKWLFDESATQKDITVDDTSSPTSNTAKLLALINNLANMEKQIKGDSDWKTAPGTNLATLATLVSNLASGSDVTWSGKKFTNAKLGITGLIDQNGYVSFGPNFGGLIIQWGNGLNVKNQTSIVNFPLAFSKSPILAVAYYNDGTDSLYTGYITSVQTNNFYWRAYNALNLSDITNGVGIYYIAIGY